MDKRLTGFIVNVILILVLAGCDVDTQPKEAMTPLLPTETLEAISVIQSGELVEVQLDTDQVRLGELSNFKLEGDHLYATITRDGESQWIIIQIPSGQTYGIDSSTSLADIGAVPQRFVVHWRRGTPGQLHQMFVYDWCEAQEKDIPLAGEPWYPIVDGNKLVWLQRQDEQWSIQGYDLAQDQSFAVISDMEKLGYVSELRISGNWIAFVDQKEERGNAELYIHHLPTAETLHLASIPYWKPFALENEHVAWIEWNEGYNEIHVYHLVSHQEKVVHRIHASDSGCKPIDVHLISDLAVWSCDKQRHGLDLAHGIEFELPLFPPGVDFEGGILHLVSGTRIVWIGHLPFDGLVHLYTQPIVRE